MPKTALYTIIFLLPEFMAAFLHPSFRSRFNRERTRWMDTDSNLSLRSIFFIFSFIIVVSGSTPKVEALSSVRNGNRSFSSIETGINSISITPALINNVNNIQPVRKLGTVVLNAQTSACGQSHPYSGRFRVCRSISARLSCYNLSTGKSGQGKLTLPPAHYEVLAPLACPPGWMCLLSEAKAQGTNLEALMVNPLTWNIDPAKFTLKPNEIIKIKAEGFNNLLMCPITIGPLE